jgi:hypothetical protein
MEANGLFYKIYAHGHESHRFLGSGFSISSDCVLTCRHVVAGLRPAEEIILTDFLHSFHIRVKAPPILPQDETIDIALLHCDFQPPRNRYFPLLPLADLQVGADVYSYGFFLSGEARIEPGYFGGKVVNFSKHRDHNCITLPYPILEGMSGSPVLTYHDGPKVVGIGIGNRSSRILASEIFEFKDAATHYKETVNRIVEYGMAHHTATIDSFLRSAGISGYVVTDQPYPVD